MAMGWEFAPFNVSTERSSRPILFPSPCAGAHLVLLMSTLLEIRRWYLNFARHQVATSCSAMFRSPSHSQLQAASHCSANAHNSLTTQGAKNAQSPIYSRSMPARNGCAEFTQICLSQHPQHRLFQYRSAQAKRCAQSSTFA